MSHARNEYLQCLADINRPTRAQVVAFSEYVAGSHSWYKHLPVFPPGAFFVFYLDPNAGRERVNGGYHDRKNDTPKSQRFYYTWQTTADYVHQYGFLQYFTDRGTHFYLRTTDGLIDTSLTMRVSRPDRSEVTLPQSIADAGSIRLTNTIHRLAEEPGMWLVLAGKMAPSRGNCLIKFPTEAPSDPLNAAKYSFLRSLEAMAEVHIQTSEWEEFIDCCVRPDATRQKEAMVNSIESMLDAIFLDAA